MKRHGTSRTLVSLLSAFALLLPLNHLQAAQGLFFSDEFDGPVLDSNRWETVIATSGVRYVDGAWVMPPAGTAYGSLSLEDSCLALGNASPTLAFPTFPLVWTNKAFPATGNFELEFRMRYTGGGYWGDGIRIIHMPTAFAPTVGDTTSAKGEYVLMIHQDNHDCKGPNVSVLGPPSEDSGPELPFNTDWHVYKLRYEGDQSTVWVDGALFTGPVATPRPNSIQLGVGEVGCCADSCGEGGCWWTSYTLDYLRVTATSTTPVEKATWGTLKARYR